VFAGLRAVAAVLFVCAGGPSVATAGDLDPPAGAVKPTMKPMSDVEPRMAVRNAFKFAAPIVISQSGSYYLAEEIVAIGGQHGIQITANNVTLDLNGFTVRGNMEVGSLDGIHIQAGVFGVTLRNGFIRDFGGSGVGGTGTKSVIVDGLVVMNNGLVDGSGIAVGDDSIAMNCIARNNGSIGILVGFNSLLKDCVAIDNGSDGLFCASGVIMGSTSTSNDADGMQTNRGVIVNSMASGNVGHGINTGTGTMVSNSSATNNTKRGVWSNNGLLTSCSIANNGEGAVGGGGSTISNNYAP
jgi:hypothetical protein